MYLEIKRKMFVFQLLFHLSADVYPFWVILNVTVTGLPFHVMFVPFLPGKRKAKSIKVLGYFLRDVFGNFVSLLVE